MQRTRALIQQPVSCGGKIWASFDMHPAACQISPPQTSPSIGRENRRTGNRVDGRTSRAVVYQVVGFYVVAARLRSGDRLIVAR